MVLSHGELSAGRVRLPEPILNLGSLAKMITLAVSMKLQYPRN